MQKEKLSALMDGETLDNELLNELGRSSEMQKTWESYHLIRDTLRGDTSEVLHFDISARVMAAIENEPVRQTVPLIPESQPAPHQWRQMPFWQKVRPWASSLTQMGVAACVSLAVIVGVQQYNGQSDSSQQPEAPVFNTMPMMGKASPVSLGVPADASALYARNLLDFLKLVIDKEGHFHLNLEDDIVAACLMCRDGQVIRKNA